MDDIKPGDLCVYFEIDSLLPAIPEFEFMVKRGIKKTYIDGKEYAGYRLKTIKLRGQISQGLCLPLSILKGKFSGLDSGTEKSTYEFKEGDDVTALLGVVKYEPPIPAHLSGKVRGMFPSFIPKTDETRIQAVPEVLQRHHDKAFYVTEKLDGSSVSFFIKDNEFHVCSRNLDLLNDDSNTIWRVSKELKIEEMLVPLKERYALQREIVGEGINGNKLKIKNQKIFFFNVYDILERKYLDFKEFHEFLESLGLPAVPIIETNYKLPKTVDEIVAFATEKSIINPHVWAEGFIFRPLHETKDDDLEGRLSFKVINPEFLLEYGE